MFSKSCEYAIRAVIFIATHQGEKVGIKDIAESVNSPESFTGKILQLLVKDKIVSSMKGPTGGFYIDPKKLTKVCLIHIVEAIDGDNVFNGCGLGLEQCNAKKPCPMHHQFQHVRDSLKEMLKTSTLKQLLENLHKGESYLRI